MLKMDPNAEATKNSPVEFISGYGTIETGVKSDPAFCLGPSIEKTNWGRDRTG